MTSGWADVPDFKIPSPDDASRASPRFAPRSQRERERDLRRGAAAKAAYEERRLRDVVFGTRTWMFGEPAWDILLDLYYREIEGRSVAVTGSCVASSKSTTSAMRHIDRLERQGLVVRVRDVQDARRSWMRLTTEARSLMGQLMDQLIDRDRGAVHGPSSRNERAYLP